MGPKAKKKTKAELEEEKLAREEEERKAKIAEEKRQAEEKEKKRQEMLKLAAEQKALREKELQRWNEQYAEILDELKSNEQQLRAEEKQEEAQLEWLSFKNPTDEPNAEVEKDMNTFLTLARETNLADLKDTMQYIKRIEKLAKAVEDVWVNSMTKQDTVKRDRALRDLQALHDLVMDKIDQATLKILQYYEKHINDKYIMHIDEIASQISVGFWASYEEPRPAGMKRPQPWENTGAHLEVIPKNLLQQTDRYVFRVIRTPIVTYNLQAYHSAPLSTTDNPTDSTSNNNSDNSSGNSASSPAGDAVTTGDAAGTTTGNNTNADANTGGGGGGDTAASSNNEDTSDNNKRNNSNSNDPAASSSSSSSSSSTLRQRFQPHQLKYVVGDLIHFEILIAPPTPYQLRVKRWTMRDAGKQSSQVRKSNYPTSSYCKLWLRIPNHVVMSDDLRLCVWDADKEDWVEDGIAEFQYNETLRMVQCNLTTVGVFALVKNRTVDLPLRSFKMYPVVSRKIHKLLQEAVVNNNNNNNNNYNGSDQLQMSYPHQRHSEAVSGDVTAVDTGESGNNNSSSNTVGGNGNGEAETNGNVENNPTSTAAAATSVMSNSYNASSSAAAAAAAASSPLCDATTIPLCLYRALNAQQFRGLPPPLRQETHFPTDRHDVTTSKSTTTTGGGGDAVVVDRNDPQHHRHHEGGEGDAGNAHHQQPHEQQQQQFQQGEIWQIYNHHGSLVPQSYERHSRLHLHTRSHEIVLDIVGSQVCLLQPTAAFVEDLLGVPMSPASLLYRLLKKGINLLPTDVDLFVLTQGNIKHRVLENEVWQQLATCASTMDFTSSPWNQTLSPSQIGILAREATVYTCPTEENEYECLLSERDEVTLSYQNTPDLGLAPGPDGVQYALVMGNEYGKRKNLFSPVLRPGEEKHLEMKRCLTKRVSPEAMERIQRVNQRFRKTVYHLLQMLRIYTLS